MIDLPVQPWQMPVFAMGALALPVALFWLVGYIKTKIPRVAGGNRHEEQSADNPVAREKVRTALFLAIALTLAVLCVLALGPAIADVVAALLSGISGLVSAVLALLSFIWGRQAEVDLVPARKQAQEAEAQLAAVRQEQEEVGADPE